MNGENNLKEWSIVKKNELYITVGVKNTVPPMVIALMIEMAMEVEEKDYLQVFRVSVRDGFSIIKLIQEVPVYERSIKISWVPEHDLKLFFMDNVFMLAEEY